MSAECCKVPEAPPNAIPPGYRRILWIALVSNFAMFGVELAGGLGAQSASLLADAVDFLGDAGNYGISLFVLTMALSWRARTALLKGLTMGAYGVYVLGQVAWNAYNGAAPVAATMGVIGALALAVNLTVAYLLYAYREGDANMRSVWLCSRNDAIGNIAIMVAAVGVFGTGTLWPDLLVGVIMGTLSLWSSIQVIRHARDELAEPLAAKPVVHS